MPAWSVVTIVVVYVGALFWIAWKQDQDARVSTHFVPSPFIYVLALAVYCTSWTYFGAVGTAVSSGWEYLPIYLGPALVFLLFPGIIRRIADIAQRESVTSLSDFLSARYGKSRSLAALATIAAVAGTLPYIALQLESIGSSFHALTSRFDEPAPAQMGNTLLLTTFALAAFVILFGARDSDSTKHNVGLMRVLAVEAIIKLSALIGVCVLSLGILFQNGFEPHALPMHAFEKQHFSGRFITLLILSMAAIICLPRQFHVAIIERRNDNDITLARWLFPAYLCITSLVVIPIALAGLSVLPTTSAPDLYVIDLPRLHGNSLLAVFVFLGGFSAATGMVIVSTVALSTMVSNDLVVPAIMRFGRFQHLTGKAGARLLIVKRSVIILILLLAYGYYHIAGSSEALAQTGLISFAAAIQFSPALIGAIYWRAGKGIGALAGLCVGMGIWVYTLFLPALIGHATISTMMPAILNPYGFFGITFGDSLTHGVVWSLGVNITLFVLVSLHNKERLRDRVQAAVFLGDNTDMLAVGDPLKAQASGITPGGLHALAARFLNTEAVDHAFAHFAQETGIRVRGEKPADWRLIQRTERMLASALGASSARIVLASAIGGQDVALGEVLSILDHKTQAERFDRHMLRSMLENMSNGISVVDHEQRLVAWNSRYAELFCYPDRLLYVGVPVKELITYNLQLGWIDGDPDEQAVRRVEYMRAGHPHTYERQNPDGRYIRILGNPMPGGGYVTSFIDITEDKKREQELIATNESLETRVRDRTQDLEAMADALNESRKEAISANMSKTRFLAAASHDLLQPLNAARLFLGSLQSNENISSPRCTDLISKTDKSIQSADDLLKGLLDISRLDHGKFDAHPVSLPLGSLLEDLADEAAPMAIKVGLGIRVMPTRLYVLADPDFLKSILRNFISNARRYTKKGRILIGARRRGDMVRIEVWDTGPGIAADKFDLLFEEFQRLDDIDNTGIRGAGLGLSIAKRLSFAMGTRLQVRSQLGKGSVFAISCPISVTNYPRTIPKTILPMKANDKLTGMKVLCVDDELTILKGMQALLHSWGCIPHIVQCPELAHTLCETESFDALIADFDLKHTIDGLKIITAVQPTLRDRRNVALLTAKTDIERFYSNDIAVTDVLKKPVNPDDIRTFLYECVDRLDSCLQSTHTTPIK